MHLLQCSMSGSQVTAGHMTETAPPATPVFGPSPSVQSFAELSPDVLAELGARLSLSDVGSLQLVSRGVRASVQANEPLWAAQYRMRWVHSSLCRRRCLVRRGMPRWRGTA